MPAVVASECSGQLFERRSSGGRKPSAWCTLGIMKLIKPLCSSG